MVAYKFPNESLLYFSVFFNVIYDNLSIRNSSFFLIASIAMNIISFYLLNYVHALNTENVVKFVNWNCEKMRHINHWNLFFLILIWYDILNTHLEIKQLFIINWRGMECRNSLDMGWRKMGYMREGWILLFGFFCSLEGWNA